MKRLDHRPKLFVLGLCGLCFSLCGEVTPAVVLTITPTDPAITTGQTQQFTVSGAASLSGIGAGGEYTCVRLPDGTAYCTGRNQFGQLGDGSWTNSSLLVPVSGLSTVTRVAAGDEFACALLADGTARCWGLGEQGQRGDGTTDQISLVPVPVSGLANAVALTAGYTHACALLGDGTIRCWGANPDGQLGDPFTPPAGSSVPVTVFNISSATAIAAGAFHACAVLADRTVRCWGNNSNGQLGDGTLMSSSTPVPVQSLSGVTDITAGGHHTCALLTDGTVGRG